MKLKAGSKVLLVNTKDMFSNGSTSYETFVERYGNIGTVVSVEKDGFHMVEFMEGLFGVGIFFVYDYNMEVIG